MKKLFLILCVVILTSCSCKSNYHKLASDDKHTLDTDGVIIGIEKYDRGCVGKQKGIDVSRYKVDTSNKKNAKLFKRLNSQKKVMVVSHIINYKNGIKKDLYNPFKKTDNTTPSYEQGYQELDRLQNKITKDILDGNYTHIIIMAMGWHNDQFESIDRYKQIISKIKHQDYQKIFNPYIIAITWPSSWASDALKPMEAMGHIGSYWNKANDADEIGFTIMNYILHNVVLSVVNNLHNEKRNIKTIAIAHSFGARLVSRAIFSKDFLKKDRSNGRALDLFIGLEPAFSANRFIRGGGIEGSPYASHDTLTTKFLITTSMYDKANPVAFWSEHLGGKDALNTIEKHKDDYNVYTVKVEYGNVVGLNFNELWKKPKKVEYIKCEFIKDHNDILDDEMGVFLYDVITKSKI